MTTDQYDGLCFYVNSNASTERPIVDNFYLAACPSAAGTVGAGH